MSSPREPCAPITMATTISSNQSCRPLLNGEKKKKLKDKITPDRQANLANFQKTAGKEDYL